LIAKFATASYRPYELHSLTIRADIARRTTDHRPPSVSTQKDNQCYALDVACDGVTALNLLKAVAAACQERKTLH
jgi:hypothetical protein